MDRRKRMQDTIALLLRTEGTFRRFLEKKLVPTRVFPTQHRTLMDLNLNPACSQMELADRFGVSAAAVTVSLKKLEKGGYITRQTDRQDNRVNHVMITEKGKEVVQQSLQLFAETDEIFFKGFSEGEMEQLYSLLNRAKENLERAESDIDSGRKAEN